MKGQILCAQCSLANGGSGGQIHTSSLFKDIISRLSIYDLLVFKQFKLKSLCQSWSLNIWTKEQHKCANVGSVCGFLMYVLTKFCCFCHSLTNHLVMHECYTPQQLNFHNHNAKSWPKVGLEKNSHSKSLKIQDEVLFSYQ